MNFDHRHIFNLAYSLELPGPRSGFAKAALGGWQISGVSQFQSGVNLQANAQGLNFAAGNGIPGYGRNGLAIVGTPDMAVYPWVICDPGKNLAKNQYINGGCFAAPRVGERGNYNFPDVRGPAFYNNDVSLFKNFAFSETKRLQFRFSAFNFLNKSLPSFTGGDELNLRFGPDGRNANPDYGFATVRYGHRVVQMAVKYSF
jgi:hypothetical protein